jgi:diaminopimelate epimerase
MRFEKWQALGNDYVILEERALPFVLTPERVRRLCAAHTGIGADGVLLLSQAAAPHLAARLRIFNPDGSEAELSGNGAREAALYLRRSGWTDQDSFSIQTAAGEIRPRITSASTCTIDIGAARLSSEDYPAGGGDGRGELTAGGRRWRFQHVQVGNPQCAIRLGDIDELEALELGEYGPEIERHELFPNRTNVSWYAPLGPDRIRARIFERGVGETSASGTGATGAAVAHLLAGAPRALGGERAGVHPPRPVERAGVHPPRRAKRAVTVVLDGGELEVEVAEDLQVNLTGWAVPVFRGKLSDELIEELT